MKSALNETEGKFEPVSIDAGPFVQSSAVRVEPKEVARSTPVPSASRDSASSGLVDSRHRETRSVHRRLFCFHCNRSEDHWLIKPDNWLSNFLLTYFRSLMIWWGPFYCCCCNHSRLFGSDRRNPKYRWMQWLLEREESKRSKKRRRSSRKKEKIEFSLSLLKSTASLETLKMDELNSLEPEFEYDLPEPVETEQEKEIRRVQKTLYCFHCNRKESHVPIKSYNRLSSFILGMTFGLTRLIGPFYCRCCGNSRLFWADWVNPRYHWIQWQYHRVAKRRRRRR